MLVLFQGLAVAALLLMIVMVVLAPGKAERHTRDVFLNALSCGRGLEIYFWRKLWTLPAHARLTIVDDGSDRFRARVIEKILAKNPGVALKTITVRPTFDLENGTKVTTMPTDHLPS
jgi:hypothetical protein